MDQQLNLNGKVFTSWKFDESTWIITASNGTLYLYLLEGEDYALLIDTAYGFGNLREYVESLTNKPVLVALTHGHLDHSGGAAEWEKVYMHKNAPVDMPSESIVNNLPYPDYERVFVGDGDVIDLGGRKIEVIDITAHSNGSLAFLDASHKLIFTGDELESMQVIMLNLGGEADYDYEARVKAHKANMLKLKTRSDEFNYVCPAHNGAPIAKSYVDDFIDLNDHILAGDAIIEDKLNHMFFDNSPMGEGVCRVRWNNASFFSSREDVEKFSK
ncbi:MAG: MBL fold metallo-hydrolase [Eubacteriales bacterium]|jgi:hydroxyacylglutathione hydrolase